MSLQGDCAGIPLMMSFDNKLQTLGTITFASELQPSNLQATKKLCQPSSEQRMIELIHDNAGYRRELQFFRRSFSACESLSRRVHSVSQELILNFYLLPRDDGERESEWVRLADGLEDALGQYKQEIQRAEDDWIRLAQKQSKRDRAKVL